MAGMVESDKIDVGFSGKRCIHSRHCVLDAPSVFLANTPGPVRRHYRQLIKTLVVQAIAD